MDQLAQGALERAEAVGRIEAMEARTAQAAPAVLVQREPVLERRPAAHTEVFGGQWFHACEAAAAHRDARPLLERLTANAAFIGKNKREETVRNPAQDGGERDRGTCGQPATREDPPPRAAADSQQLLVLPFLTTDAVPRPRHGVQTLFLDRPAALRALAELASFDPR